MVKKILSCIMASTLILAASLCSADEALVLGAGGGTVYRYSVSGATDVVSQSSFTSIVGGGFDITTGNFLPGVPGIEIAILRDWGIDIYKQDGVYQGSFHLIPAGTTQISSGDVLPGVPGDEIIGLWPVEGTGTSARNHGWIGYNFDLSAGEFGYVLSDFWTARMITRIAVGDVMPDDTFYTSGADGIMGTNDDVLVSTPGDEIVGLGPWLSWADDIDIYYNLETTTSNIGTTPGYIGFPAATVGITDIAVGNFLTGSNNPGDEVLGARSWAIDYYTASGYIGGFWAVLSPQLAVGKFGLYQLMGLREWAIDYYDATGYKGGFWVPLGIAITTLPSDTDNDGVRDSKDLYPNTPVGTIVNSDGGSLDQVLAEAYSDTYRNHGEFVSTVAAIAEEFEALGEDVSGVVADAAKSTIGIPQNSQKPGKGN